MAKREGYSGASLPSPGTDATKRNVSYFYEPDISEFYYGQGHPMKPHRISIAHNLIIHYNLYQKMDIIRPFPAQESDIRRFHSPDYVDFLASVTPEMLDDQANSRVLNKYNIGQDCPVFDGLYSFCQASAGGSIGAAVKLNLQESDIAINWAGGLHHAKKSEAYGFCYVNDIVLGILELLKCHQRVLYIDIDIHHGDGVEEAFYTTNRVMTVSFHKYGDNFFPRTGHIKDIGQGEGKHYSLNVPLNTGIDDESFRNLFQPIIRKVMEAYNPNAVVLQCGADSLAGDKTAVAVGVELDNKLPSNEYYEYFGPDYTLHVRPNPIHENKNTAAELEKLRNLVLEQVSRLPYAPSVQFQTAPPVTKVPEEAEEKIDIRPVPRLWNGEDCEYEGEGKA